MNNVALGIAATLCLITFPQLIICPFHQVTFDDLLLFLNTSFKIYIFTMRATSEPCPYYVKDSLNESYYTFNLTTEESCKANTRRFNAVLGKTVENTPYMDIQNFTGLTTLRKEMRYYNNGEKCGIFAYRESRRTHYELHVWDIKFAILNGSKVFHSCFSVYYAYTSQLTDRRHECSHGCS
uniref:Lipocalin n=1 Tax=Rhipicephalus appendiculatus TaxID=34631 RepID=A0A131YSA0_RHIAP